MAKIFLTSISLLVGLVILTAVVSIVGFQEIIGVLSRFSLWGIIPLVVFTILANLTSAIKWQYVLRVVGCKIALWPLLKIWLIGFAMSYLTPVAYIGGEFFRCYLLKEKYGVSWIKSMSSIAVEKITESVIWISTIFLGALIFLTSPHAPTLSRLLSASILGILFFGGALALIFIFILQKKSIIYALILKPFGLEKSQSGKFLHTVEKDLQDFFAPRNRKHFFWVMKVSFLKYTFFWLRNVFLIYYLAGIVSVSGGTMSVGFLQLSYIFPVPAALGAQEGLLSAVFSGTGYGTGFGAAFSLLLRVADILVVAVGIYFGAKWGISKFVLGALRLFKIRIPKEEL